MSSLVPKIALGCIGSSGIIAGAIYASLPEKYSHHFEKQGRQLITDFSETKWNEIEKFYGENGDGLSITKEGQNKLDKEQWASWCSENSNNTFTDTKDTKYQRVSAWCTEPKKISDLVEDKALDDKEPTSGEHANQSDWKNKMTKYNSVTDNKQLIKEITEDNSAKKEGEEIVAKSLTETKKLRAWCAFTKEQHFKHEEDQRYKNYLLWCTK